MQLTQAFNVQHKDVVAFVGGGGKTTMIFRLAAELAHAGRRVVTTTTTRILFEQVKLAPSHILAENDTQALNDIRASMQTHNHVLVIGAANEKSRRLSELTPDEKAFGVSPALVDRIIALDEVDVVLVEADGSRMRPFKAPNEHEPPVPASTTLLVPVVGIDAAGLPLNDAHAHRAEIVAELAGVKRGTVIGPELIARVLTHPQGGLKNRPAHGRVILFVNKAQSVSDFLAARQIAVLALTDRAVEAVAIGAVQNPDLPIAELHRRVAAVVLAAGKGRRMEGRVKQLLPWGETTLLQHALDSVRASRASETVLVLGANAAEIQAMLNLRGVRAVLNTAWPEGRASSLRSGLRAVGEWCAAAVFVNADQPFLTPEMIDAVLHHYYQTGAPVVVPLYDGQRGSPVLFARELFDEMTQLRGEQGGRDLLETHAAQLVEVTMPDARGAIDVDTLEEYERARQLARV